MKTYQDWEDSELDLDEFLQPGDEIDYEIYEHIGYALVGANFDDGTTLQCGECSFEREGIEYYATATEKDGKYFYLGDLPDKNKSHKQIKLPSPKIKKRELQVGDSVVVMDPGLLMLQQFAPKDSKPNNEGIILEIWKDDDMALIQFPIGDDDPDEHSQAAPYPISVISLKK